MIKKLTCIECPLGCSLSVDVENCKVIKTSGNKCPKGQTYAVSEIENPMRVLTSTVLTKEVPLKMLPVRTDNPIPKTKIFDAANEIKKIIVSKPVHVGDVIVFNFLGLEVNLIATRDCLKKN